MSTQKERLLFHTIVYQEPGRFGGWPANGGIWSWGDEILVCFERAYYRENTQGHSIIPERTAEIGLARSLDGGSTWTLEEPGVLGDRSAQPAALSQGIDFSNPDLAIRCSGGMFHVSGNRGKTWAGPYALETFGRQLTARTDYRVLGPQECLFFLSAHEPRVQAGLQDRAFCAKTSDGGRTFVFQGWMTGEPLEVRSVMPATVPLVDGSLVSALRRRFDQKTEGGSGPHCWIDLYRSADEGRTWEFLSKAAETGDHNGNPPALIGLKDGRLCVAYGVRRPPYGIRARLSADGGSTWGEELVLRADGRTWDLGYPRMIQRQDGNLITIYYFTTEEHPQQHIAATIWHPDGSE